MPKTLYLNIPVKDSVKSRAFYEAIGFEVKVDYSSPTSETVTINDSTLLMLVNEPFFKKATKRDIADTTTHAETELAIDVETRSAVDTMVNAALANGGVEVDTAFEHEGMYTRIFLDLDGHQYNVFAFVE